MTVPRAAVVVTGTEMINGQVTDRNGPWVAQRLGELGLRVGHLLCVGDRPADLLSALRFIRDQGADLVVTSGGLGPTADDLTAEVVAGFAGVTLELDTELEAKIAAILAKFARRFAAFDPQALADANRKQAMVPQGATALDPVGTAPGLVVPVAGGPTVVVLPGPPRELQAMWPAALAAPAVRSVLERAEPVRLQTLRLFGLPESEIAATLRELGEHLDLSPLEITTCLRRSELEVDIRHRPGGARIAAELAVEISRRHERQLFSDDGSTIDDQVADLLGGRTIAVAESCTGGLLAGRLTDRPGSSAYVMGGVVCYSNEAKTAQLGVPADLIAAHGAVSAQVAQAMAEGVRRSFGTDVGVGITGVAGPGGGTDAKPVGTVCVSVCSADAAVTRDVVLPGDRAEVRDRSVALALHLIRRLLRAG